jgi:glycosyltransferase involved in cell wall biosynthesis
MFRAAGRAVSWAPGSARPAPVRGRPPPDPMPDTRTLDAPRPAPATQPPPAFLVVAKSGPVYNVGDQLQYQAELLSRVYPGVIITHGPSAWHQRVGRVDIRCLAVPDVGRTRAQQIRYMLRAAALGSRAIRESGLPGLVVSYDPLASGIIARLVKLRTGARFICEVNGVYGNPDNFADEPDAVARTRRTTRIASRVLRAADGVRLLYHGQLAGLDVATARKAVRAYFDPIPLERFPDMGEEPYLLFVGHPYRRKGVDLLLEAFARVRDRHPAWRLVLIGHELDRHVPAAGVTLERVEVLKPMNNERLVPYVGKCAAIILPSRSEAMGRVLLEAAAAGKPRVGAAVDGIPSVIADGEDGLLFPKEDVGALAGALDRLMGSPELRRRLGAAARARALRDYSGDRFVELFGELASAAFRPPHARA